MNETKENPIQKAPLFAATQPLSRRIELVAWAIYAVLFISCLGQFAGRPFLTSALALAALAAFIFGRPLVRTIGVAAFLIPVLTLINDYRIRWRPPRSQPAHVLEQLKEIDRAIDGAKTPTPAPIVPTPNK